jgi:GTP-binding protein
MQIKSAQYIISSPKVEGCPAPNRPEYAFIGRSNVGKSSLINMITGHAKLAKTSASPGKTQLINHFNIKSGPDNPESKNAKTTEWYLVDLPGYGYAKVSQSQRAAWQKMISAYLTTRENLMNIFVLIDSRHEPQTKDMEFLDQLGQWQVPFTLVFTKSDKSVQRITSQNVKHFKMKMQQDWEFIPQTFITSTVKGTGRREIMDYIDELNEAYFTLQKEKAEAEK